MKYRVEPKDDNNNKKQRYLNQDSNIKNSYTYIKENLHRKLKNLTVKLQQYDDNINIAAYRERV